MAGVVRTTAPGKEAPQDTRLWPHNSVVDPGKSLSFYRTDTSHPHQSGVRYQIQLYLVTAIMTCPRRCLHAHTPLSWPYHFLSA